jgi:transposase
MTAFMNYLPSRRSRWSRWTVRECDIIISSSHAFAKGVLTTARTVAHQLRPFPDALCVGSCISSTCVTMVLIPGSRAILARWMFHRLRLWDRQTANNVDLFLGNSDHVRQRIWRTYRRPAKRAVSTGESREVRAPTAEG